MDKPQWVDISGILEGKRVVVKTARIIVRNPLEWTALPIPPGEILNWSLRNEDANHLRVCYQDKPEPNNPHFFTIMAQGLPRSEVTETWLPRHIWVQDVAAAATSNVYIEFVLPASEGSDVFSQYGEGDFESET